ncbi:hypothetical protein K469DRAFT_350790 [Zopfia rhizophila CBS 207.26]|uniref:Uncharacterized protein n=1 Tax=Zopfia rhizophila CBS 207.26 TaxID=1314779 RepID=A0A6A6DEK1_9PEZI|nr:hypothetical protein K469DRAFT_350790 [Zopfia rhizophila CBS 207.26]
MFIGVGIRGHTDDSIMDPNPFKDENKAIERLVHELGGIKWLYSRSSYTKDEFWSICSRPEYEALRIKYNAQHLPSVYEKIQTSEKPRRMPRVDGFWNHVFAKTSVLAMKHKKATA